MFSSFPTSNRIHKCSRKRSHSRRAAYRPRHRKLLLEMLEDRRLLDGADMSLSWRSSPASDSPEIISAMVGDTVYLRLDAPDQLGEQLFLEIWEDDGAIGDEQITTLAVTINMQGYGTVPWFAEWQSGDEDAPQNSYYIYYDVPWSLDSLESPALQVQIPPSNAGGVTVITHGWDLFGGVPVISGIPAWAISMGQAILDRADGSRVDRSAGCLFQHEPSDGSWRPVPEAWNNSASCSDGPVVLLYDWSWESNDTENGWLEAAADSLFAGLLSKQSSLGEQSFFDVAQADDVLNFHLIGHSRGAVLNSLAVKRFDQYFPGVEIDHVTSLDPHPWSMPPDPGYDERRLFTYDNVRFADNYYRQDGWYENDLDFDGVPADGAYNLQLDESVLSGYEDGYSSEHSDVHAWYYGTITAPFAASYAGYAGAGRNVETTGWPAVPNPDFPETWYGTAGSGLRGAVGFNYSRLGDPTLRPTSMDGERIDHTTGIGAVPTVFNGDFAYGDWLFDELPGWERHGGGGEGQLDEAGGNTYLELDSHGTTRTHNALFVPPEMPYLAFDLSITTPKHGTNLTVFMDEIVNVLGTSIALDQSTHGFVPVRLPVPSTLQGGVHTLTFAISDRGADTPQVRIDNVRFSTSDLPDFDVDRWWGYAGDEVPVALTLYAPTSGSYEFAIGGSLDGNGWRLDDGAYVRLDDVSIHYPFSLGDLGQVTLSDLSAGHHVVHVAGLRAPSQYGTESLTFTVDGPGAADYQLRTTFISERPPLSSLSGLTFADGLGGGTGTLLTLNSVQDLVAAFRPTLYFERGEEYSRPVSAVSTLDEARLFGQPLSADVRVGITPNSNAVLDLPGHAPADYRPDGSATVYASVVADEEANRLAIEYWFHYPYSNWREMGGLNNHEGDWEGIVVYLERSGTQQPFVPTAVGYAQHEQLVSLASFLTPDELDGGQLVPWAAATLPTVPSPRVYVGLGGHASYFSPGVTDWYLTAILGGSFESEAHAGNGSVLAPVDYDVLYLERAPAAAVNATPDDDWLLFPGRWGQRDLEGHSLIGDDGPFGPVFGGGGRWFDPWAWKGPFDVVSLGDVGIRGDGSQLPAGQWTILSHGLSSDDYPELTAADGWMRQLAEKLAIESGNVAFHRMQFQTLTGEAVPLEQTILPGETRAANGEWQAIGVAIGDSSYHHVLAFDWAEVSNYATAIGFLPAVEYPPANAQGDDGYAEASADALFAVTQATGIATHLQTFIGYSRGAVVGSEFVQRLLLDGDETTGIAHVIYLDAEGGGTLYQDSQFYAWDGVRTDNYYSTAPDGLGGHEVAGARNFNDGLEYAHWNFPSYLIGDQSPANGQYDGLFIRGGMIVTKDTPDTATGTANAPFAHDPPTPLGIFNGDFEFDSTAGWFYHGGGGAGLLLTAPQGNSYLVLNEAFPSRTHNWLYVPEAARSLSFDIWRNNTSADDVLRISLGEVVLGELSLVAKDQSFLPGLLAVPEGLQGKVAVLTFEIISRQGDINSQVAIDDISFSLATPEPPSAQIVGGPYTVPEGGSIQLQGAATRAVDSSHADAEYWWDLDGDGVFGETTEYALRGMERGPSPVFKTLPSDDGPQTIEIALRIVADGVDGTPAYSHATIQNIAPSAEIFGPAYVSANQTVTYHATVSDPGQQDEDNLDFSSFVWSASVGGEFHIGFGTSFTFTPNSDSQFDLKYTVGDDDGGNRTITKVINLVPSVPARVNEVMSETLTDQIDVYRFDAHAGQFLTVSAYWGNELNPSDSGVKGSGVFRLIGSDGIVLASPPNEYTVFSAPQFNVNNGKREYRFSRLGEFLVPEDGVYFVEVRGESGTYSLGISDPQEQYQDLSRDAPTDAAFGVRGNVQQWQFDATAGTGLGWTYEGRSIQAWSILDTTGVQVATGFGGGLTTIAFTPSTSGIHRLAFDDFKSDTITSAAEIGPFSYRLTPDVPALLNEVIAGSLGSSLETDLYSFQGRESGRLTVSAYWGNALNANDNALDGSGRFRVIGPDGTVVASPGVEHTVFSAPQFNVNNGKPEHYYTRLDELELPADGTYFVEVSGGIGSYWIGIADPIEQYQTLSGTMPSIAEFGVRGDVQEWEFSGSSGQTLAWTYEGRAIDGWTITDVASRELASGPGGTRATIVFVPNSDGVFRLAFQDVKSDTFTSSTQIGPFGYGLSPAVVATIGKPINGRLNSAFEANLHAFIGQAGRTVTVSAYWGNGRNSPDNALDSTGAFRLIGPDGTILASPSTEYNIAWDSQREYNWTRLDEYVLPADGTYFIEVSGGIGDYWLGISDPLEHFEVLSQTAFTETEFGVRGDVQEWEFSTTAGEAVGWTYEGQAIQGWQVFGPDGTEVASGPGGTRTTIALTPSNSGIHRLVFEDVKTTQFVSPSQIGPFAYRLTPAVAAPLDEVIHGNLAAPLETTLYTFAGQVGRKLTVSAYWGNQRNATDNALDSSGRFRLIGPDGTVLVSPSNEFNRAWNNEVEFCWSRLDEYVLPADGTYFIEVSGGIGDYWLGISDALEHFDVLSLTAFTETEFGVRGDVQEWEFSTTAGEAVGWTYEGQAIQGWKVFGPDGTEVASGPGGTRTTIALTPSNSGIHRLVFEDVKSTQFVSPSRIGPFAYRLTPAVAALLDEVIHGNLAAPLETTLYTFAGQVGRKLTVSAYWGNQRNATDNALDSSGRFRLIGPDGTVLVSPSNEFNRAWNNEVEFCWSRLDEYVLPADGTYFIEVSGGIGDYWLGISDALEHFDVLSQTAFTETEFGVRGDVQEWEFSTTAGEAVGWTYEGQVIQGWKVFGPDGTEVASGPGGTRTTIALTPSNSGIHRLVFEDVKTTQFVSPSQIGPFAYRLTPVVAAPLDEVIHGNLAAPLETTLYTFAGQVGRKLTVSAYWGNQRNATDNALDSSGRFRLIGPDGTVLVSPSNEFNRAWNNEVEFCWSRLDEYGLPADGTYFIEVSGAIGNYWLGISDPQANFELLPLSDPVAGLFGVRGDIQEYEFSAAALQSLRWLYQGRSIQGWTVRGPDGQTVASGGGGSSLEIAFTAPVSGTYSLVFTDAKATQLTSPQSIGPFHYSLTPPDTDGDQVVDNVENGAENLGDGNGDGTPDRLQANVVSLPDAVTGGYLTVAGPAGTRVFDVQSDSPPVGPLPPRVDFPAGLARYKISGLVPGASVDVRMYASAPPLGELYYVYGSTSDDPADHWYQLPSGSGAGAEFYPDHVLLHLVDGGLGDDDLIANGVLAHLGGLGQRPPKLQPEVLLEDSGNLLVLGLNRTTDADDTLTVMLDDANVRIIDPNHSIFAGAGSVQVNDHTVDVPLSAVTGGDGIVVETATGDDSLTVDFASGNPLPGGGLSYDGGSGAHDGLTVRGGSHTSAHYRFANSAGGSLTLDGSEIRYSGVEAIVHLGTATHVLFDLASSDPQAVLEDLGGGMTRLRSLNGTFPTTDFANPGPGGSITIRGGTGNDSLLVASLAAEAAGTLILEGLDGYDSVEIAANLALAGGGLNVTADTVILRGGLHIATNGGEVRLDGAVTLRGEAVSTTTVQIATAGGRIDFHGTVDADLAGQRSLWLDAGGGEIIHHAPVGSSIPLRNLTIADAGTVNIGNVATSNGLAITLAGTGIADGILSGSGSLTKAGTGTLTLRRDNTYAGPTAIHQGTLIVTGANTARGRIGAASAVTVHAGGTLRVDADNALGGGVPSNIPAVTILAGGVLTMSDNVSAHLNHLVLNGGSLSSTANPSTAWGGWTLDGNVTVTGGGTSTIDARRVTPNKPGGVTVDVAAGSTLDVTGTLVVSGNGVLGTQPIIKAGPGTLTLRGDNSYSGATYVQAGVLRVEHANALGSSASGAGTTVSNDAQIEVSGNITVAEPLSLVNSAALRGVSGGSVWRGPITVDGTWRRIWAVGSGSSLKLTGGIQIAGASESTIVFTANTGGIIEVDSNIHLGTGTVQVVEGATTFKGTGSTWSTTRIDWGGTAILGADDALPASAIVILGNSHPSGGTLSLNGFNQTVAGLVSEGTAARIIKNDAPALATLTVDNASTAYTFGGTLTGNLALSKSGAGGLTLTGLNTYRGQTIVNNGVLGIGNGGTTGTLGTGNVLNNGTLIFDRGDAINVFQQISGTGELVQAGTGTAVLFNRNTYAGRTTILAGKLQLGRGGTNDPASYWEMSEGSGSTLVNSIAGQPSGTLHNSPAWVVGPAGEATGGLSFDGSNQSASIAPNAALDDVGSGAFSVSAWLKTDTAGSWYRAIVSKFGNSMINNFWGLGWMDAHQLGFVLRDNNSPRREVRLRAPVGWGLDNQWHHIVGVRDGLGTLQLYLDGVWFATAADVVGNTANDRPIQFARHFDSTYVKEAISGVGIWDTALTADAVLQLYAYGLGLTAGSLPENTTLQIAPGATFDLNGLDQKVGALTDYDGRGGLLLLDRGTLTIGGIEAVAVFSGTLAGSGGLIKDGAGLLTLRGNNSYLGETQINTGTLRIQHPNALGSINAGTVVADGAALEVDHAGTVAEPVTIFGPGINWNGALSNRAGVNTWTGPVTLGGSLARVGAVAGTLHIAGGVDGSGGNHAFVSASAGGSQVIYDSVIDTGWGNWIIHGSGTTTLNQPAMIGSSTYVSYGNTLRLGVANALPAGTVLTLGSADGGSGRFFGRVDLAGYDQTLAGLVADGDTGNDWVTSTSGTPTLTIRSNSDSAYDGLLMGSLGLTKKGTATVALSGDNGYTGVTHVDVGVLRIQHPGALGSAIAGTFVRDGGRLELEGGITVTGESLCIDGAGGNFKGALQSIGEAANTWAGPLTLNPESTTQTRIGATGLDSSRPGTLAITGVIDGGNNWGLGIRNGEEGSGERRSLGKVVLSGVNTYFGPTQIVVGTLQLAGGDDRLPTSTALSLGNPANISTATFDLNGFNQEVVGLADLGTFMARTTMNSASATAKLTVNTTTDDSFYGGLLTGNLALTKLGPHALNLSNLHTYTGNTTVGEGTLALWNPNTNNNVTTTSLISLEQGAILDVTGLDHGENGETLALLPHQTLAGHGIVTGNLVAQEGSVLEPHDTLTLLGNLAMASDATLRIEIRGPMPGEHDQLKVSGDIRISDDVPGPLLDLTLRSGFAPTSNLQFTILDNDGTDPIANLTQFRLPSGVPLPEGTLFDLSGTNSRISYQGGSGNDIVLEFLQSSMTDLELDANTVLEKTLGAVVGQLIVTPSAAGETYSWTLSDDRFEIANGLLKLKNDRSVHRATEQIITLEITATNGNGESVTRNFSITVEPAERPVGWQFDFNTAGSPTQPSVASDHSNGDYLGVLPTDSFVAGSLYGWVTAPNGFDRGALADSAHSSLLRDGAWGSAPREFRMRVEPELTYDVTVTFGDAGFARDRMNVSVVTGDGAGLSNVATGAGQFVHRSFTATPSEQGDLVLQFSDGGGDPYWTVNAVEVRPVVAEFSVVGPGDTPVADGETLDVFQVTGATPGALYTLSTMLGTIVGVTDADPRYAGLQTVATDSDFSFQVQRGSIAGRAAGPRRGSDRGIARHRGAGVPGQSGSAVRLQQRRLADRNRVHWSGLEQRVQRGAGVRLAERRADICPRHRESVASGRALGHEQYVPGGCGRHGGGPRDLRRECNRGRREFRSQPRCGAGRERGHASVERLGDRSGPVPAPVVRSRGRGRPVESADLQRRRRSVFHDQCLGDPGERYGGRSRACQRRRRELSRHGHPRGLGYLSNLGGLDRYGG
jgi:autotransporter-associated beta strand protein